ncbi:PQQ-dependent catabolism-associated CXXCW motif protein [Filomicrobium insigne]|uniref:PQQ-dependent catabolism-associated CXXCW motif protein n=1 Tax=Filomicrobium insigne TaxID=418854 RepID=A0A1H0SLG8_9HYPH|nr:PQQ-dependent catabolism-associated CXXCW motif protein [Filomicrobium insigne]
MVAHIVGLVGSGCGARSFSLLVRYVLLVQVIGLFVLSGVSDVFAAGGKSVEPLVTEPDTYRTDNYRAPVPATLKGAQVVDVGAAEDLWNAKAAVFIDVYPQPPKPPNLPEGTIWRTPSHESIAGAHWLANVGYGVLSPEYEGYFRAGLERLTEGDRSRPVVFFCLRDCWMSWNAARRALSWGYRNVIWFPDGTDGWKELGLPAAQIKPVS